MNIEDKQVLELLPEMTRRWGDMLNPTLQSIKFSQTEKLAVIELTFLNDKGEIVTEITKLDFISGDDIEDMLFRPENDVVDNAQNFVTFDGYSLINCFSNLFHPQAEEEINGLHLKSMTF